MGPNSEVLSGPTCLPVHNSRDDAEMRRVAASAVRAAETARTAQVCVVAQVVHDQIRRHDADELGIDVPVDLTITPLGVDDAIARWRYPTLIPPTAVRENRDPQKDAEQGSGRVPPNHKTTRA